MVCFSKGISTSFNTINVFSSVYLTYQNHIRTVVIHGAFFYRNSKICYNSTKIHIVSIWVNRIQSNRLIVQKNVNWQFVCWQFKYKNFVRQKKETKKNKNSYQLKWNSIELKHPAAELSWSNAIKLHLFPSNFSFSSTDFFQYLFRLNVHHSNCLCENKSTTNILRMLHSCVQK